MRYLLFVKGEVPSASWAVLNLAALFSFLIIGAWSLVANAQLTQETSYFSTESEDQGPEEPEAVEEGRNRGWYLGGAAAALPYTRPPNTVLHYGEHLTPVPRCNLHFEHQTVYSQGNDFHGHAAHTLPTDPEWDMLCGGVSFSTPPARFVSSWKGYSYSTSAGYAWENFRIEGEYVYERPGLLQ